jgi:hypothetical protein
MRWSLSPLPSTRERGTVNVYALMSHLGLDPGAGVVPQFAVAYSAAVRRCRTCDVKADCDAWLAEPRVEGRHVPAFCPCVDILSELQFARLPRPSRSLGCPRAGRRVGPQPAR